MRTRYDFRTLACATLGLLLSQSAVAGLDANALVAAADAIRFPTEAFQIQVKVTTGGRSGPEVHEYQVLQKGHDNSVVRTLSPASEKGQVMLLKGADLWVFLPQVSQPVRLPLSQRLTGQVANGDLARANFAGDYNATLVKEEALDGKACAQLELMAARKGVTYQRVLYWVETATRRPVKVEFYTVSKRLMKSGIYSDFKDMGGVLRPTRLTLTDALRKGEQSVLEYTGLKKREIPDKVFSKEFLRKLQE